MNDFARFAREHVTRLQHVRDRWSLAEWHSGFAQAWSLNASKLAASANLAAGLHGEHALQSDVGYLAVERRVPGAQPRPAWVLVSANPGWNARINARERELKGQPHSDGALDLPAYASYRADFFERWYPQVMVAAGSGRSAAWWNKAVGFLHKLHGLTKPAGMMSLHPDFDVIGWELWPFHSTRDGLTRQLGQGPTSPLATFAVGSLRAALRIDGTEGVLAASKAAVSVAAILQSELPPGTLLHDAARSGVLEQVFTTRVPGKNRRVQVRVDRYTYTPNGRKLIVVGRQIFSNFGTLPVPLQEQLITTLTQDLAIDARAAAPAARAATLGPEPTATACVAFEACSAGRPVVIAVAVKETEFLDAPATLDEEQMQSRTVGIWPLSLAHPAVTRVREALTDGRRAFVMARAAGEILRLYEILARHDPEAPAEFTHQERDRFRRMRREPPELMGPGGRPFATGYECEGVVRVRFHAVDCQDEQLRAVPIDASITLSIWPQACTFGDLEDPRVAALLSAAPLATG